MIPKATMRQGGSKMMTIRVEQHISPENVAAVICYELDLLYDSNPEFDKLTRTRVWKRVHKHYKHMYATVRNECCDWFDEQAPYSTEDVINEVKQSCLAKVYELFPEFIQ